MLTLLAEDYEERHYAVPLPDPIEAIHYHMESRGLTRRDLEPYVGTRARVSEILNRRRAAPAAIAESRPSEPET